jgi:hypothetical protein
VIIDQGKLTDGAFSNGGKFTAAGIFRNNFDLGKYVAADVNKTGGKFAAGINDTNDIGGQSAAGASLTLGGAQISSRIQQKIEMTLKFFTQHSWLKIKQGTCRTFSKVSTL